LHPDQGIAAGDDIQAMMDALSGGDAFYDPLAMVGTTTPPEAGGAR
ncbi:MAG: hypothetical protein ACJAXT_001979, partial [Paracoccaceae bacterium]